MDLFYPNEHKKAPDRLADYVQWGALVKPGVILNKNGAFMAVAKFRGHDLESSTKETLTQVSVQMNAVLARFGSNWCVHVEARRRDAHDYPDSTWPTAAAWLIDAEREADFRAEGRHYENDYYISFTFLPPASRNAKLQEFMFDDPAGKKSEASIYSDHLERFVTQVDDAVNALRLNLPLARRLTSEETLSYLNSCVSNSMQPVAVPDTPINLDYLLTNTPVTGGLAPRLGDRHLRTIGFRNYPESSVPGLLDALNRLPIPYRWVVRYLPMDHGEAEKALKKKHKHWYGARYGIGAIFRQALNPSGGPGFANPDADRKAEDIQGAIAELGTGFIGFGHITPTITVTGATEEEVTERCRIIMGVIQQRGFVAAVEDLNAVDAWLGSLPGEPYADARRPLMSSLNLSHFLPMSAVWGGPTENEHLSGPPLIQTKAEGNTPFRLDLHQGDVAHTQIFGPTGKGKSVLLNMLCAQFLRYEDAQVYIFEIGASARCLTLAMDGDHYDLGDSASVAFQPLRAIDDQNERLWALDWLLSICEAAKVHATPDVREKVWSALETLAKSPREHRRLSMLRNLVQDDAIKSAFGPYCSANDPNEATDEDGPYAYLLDAAEENLDYAAWQTFELEQLTHQKHAVGPVLEYLFHRLEQRFDGRPTALVLDEAWLFLDNPRFAAKIKEWLKTLRKKNVGVWFATQSLSDVAESNIAAAIFENCPTAIYLPNPDATNEQVRGAYERKGLNAKQIQNISTAIGKRDYYYVSASGSRMFQLGLGPASPGSLALVASSSKDDHKKIDQMLAEGGKADFAERWLRARGLPEHADAIRDFNAAYDRAESATAPMEEPAHAIAAE